MNRIFYGIIRVDFIMEVGKLIQMVKVKNMGRESVSIRKANSMKASFSIIRGLAMVFKFMLMAIFTLGSF